MYIESGDDFGLNEAASCIWNQLEHPRSVGDLHALVLGEFEVEEARCQTDALTFLRGRIEDGLMQVADTETTSAADTGATPERAP